MPRRTKKNEFSGSPLLGSELRRLRGVRTLEDIQALCKSPPLAGKVIPISSSALCEIEQGRQMPRLTTLFALSLVYRVSMNQLMGFVMEEQMVNAMRLNDTADEDLQATFARLLATGAWHEALPLAIRGERRAKTERERLSWRGNRATCLSNVGLNAEATDLLTNCLGSPAFSRRQEFALLHNLADIYAANGSFRMAELLLREALELLPEDAQPADATALGQLRASLMIDIEETKSAPSERTVREALRLAEKAEKSCPEGHLPTKLQLQCLRARGQHLLGNALVAARDLEQALAQASELRLPRVEAWASLCLAKVRLAQRQPAQAEVLLLRAASVSEACQQNDILFSASLELFRLLRNERPGSAVAWFRRCKELAPLLPRHSPTVQAFERVAEEMAR